MKMHKIYREEACHMELENETENGKTRNRIEVDSRKSFRLLFISRRHRMKVIQVPSISNKLKVKSEGLVSEVVDDSRVVWMDDENDNIIM